MKNPPAFPRPASIDTSSGTLPDGDRVVPEQDGLGLRDYFAARALEGMLANPALMECVTRKDIGDGTAGERVCSKAYEFADQMLAQREK